MLIRSLVVVGLVGLASLAAGRAVAENIHDRLAPAAAIDGVSFADPSPFASSSHVRMSVEDRSHERLSDYGSRQTLAPSEASMERSYEVAFGQSGVAGLPVDVEFAQRATIGVNSSGDISRHGRGSELRLGRGLKGMSRRSEGSWTHPTWYVFAAADDEALTWAPSVRSAFGGSSSSVALQDRVEIGDRQIGVTYEVGHMQASLAYVEREVSAYVAGRSLSHDENFAGLTITVKH